MSLNFAHSGWGIVAAAVVVSLAACGDSSESQVGTTLESKVQTTVAAVRKLEPADADSKVVSPKIAKVARLWADLSEQQQQILAPLRDDWQDLTVQQKSRWIQVANRYPDLAEADQQRTQERMKEWAMLSPEERLKIRTSYRQAQSLAREERLAQWEHYQNLTDEQKRILSDYGVGHETAAAKVSQRSALARQASKPLVASELQPAPNVQEN